MGDPRSNASAQRPNKLHSIGMSALKRRFSPEFVNRIDRVITYRPLTAEALEQILQHQLEAFGELVINRLGPRGFEITVDPAARQFLLNEGASDEYGARELKRVLHRHLFQPLAAMVADGGIPPAASVRVSKHPDAAKLRFRISSRRRPVERMDDDE